MTEVEQPPQNGIDLSAAEDDDSSKARPADIEQDMREMERRKRVEAIMGSKLFREELERIVDSAREGGASGILQQLSDIVGVPSSRVGNVFKASNCMLPINDIRGVESMGYAKGEKILRCKLAATFRLLDLYGWTQGLGAQITARLKVDQEYFLVNPYGLLYHEITASSLNKVDMQGQIVEQGTTNFGVNKSHFILHSVVHAARPDIRCAIYIGCSPVVAISSLKTGLLPLTKDACVLGEISTHPYSGSLLDADERDKLVRNLGPNSKVVLLSNHGALCCGETIEEAFYAACHIVQACETQLKLLPVGVDNLVLIPEESRKIIYEQSRRPPEDLEKKFAAAVSTIEAAQKEAGGSGEESAVVAAVKSGASPKWRVGGAEFEALMRMLDNAGYRTGYIYRHPLVKTEPPKPKNDVELPPAVSSLGYLLEEEELYRQGIWKKGDLRKGGDRSRWLNSPNVYQKVEVLETGTPDPKKITKWVAEGSPTHSTPVRIEDPLQFVPAGTNPKEFKRLQQQIKDNRRADKISAGPQSHILEGVTWDEANRIKDATVSSAGDHVVLMGAASKGIIQRGYQHNATVYKAPYAKNPFDNVTDDELNEYKRTVERKKKSIHGEYTDTDFSESEALSSLQTSGAQQTKQTTTTTTAAVSQSEPEDASEHQVLRIETQQAPIPSQPEVVLSDVNALNTYQAQLLKIIKNYFQPNHKMLLNECAATQNNCCDLAKRYAFLYNEPSSAQNSDYTMQLSLYTIHKIEIFPNHKYPLSDNNANQHSTSFNTADEHSKSFVQQAVAAFSAKQSKCTVATQTGTATPTTASTPTIPPYRTLSHYGFNYPLTYLPTVTVHPALLQTAHELQQKMLNAYDFTHQMDLHITPQDSAAEQTVSDGTLHTPVRFSTLQRNDNHTSFISMQEMQLQQNQNTFQYHHRNVKSLSRSHNNITTMLANAQQQQRIELDDANVGFNFYHSDYNSITFAAPRNTVTESLYRSCLTLSFVHINDINRARSYDHDHKPESDQHQQQQKPYTRHTEPQQQQQAHLASASLSSQSDTSSAMNNLIEIHITVTYESENFVKRLRSCEKEFKTKVDQIIDDEIKLIVKQLVEQYVALLLQQQQQQQTSLRSTDSQVSMDDAATAAVSTLSLHRHAKDVHVSDDGSAGTKPSEIAAAAKAIPIAHLRYQHTLQLLEVKVADHLNDIICEQALSNNIVMCKCCKVKISKISLH